jgi:hypothetical protein
MNLGHWKARLGYALFEVGCRLIAAGARLLPSIAGWDAGLSFTDNTRHGTGQVLDVEHWRGQLDVNPGRGGVIVDPSMPAGTELRSGLD